MKTNKDKLREKQKRDSDNTEKYAKDEWKMEHERAFNLGRIQGSSETCEAIMKDIATLKIHSVELYLKKEHAKVRRLAYNKALKEIKQLLAQNNDNAKSEEKE